MFFTRASTLLKSHDKGILSTSLSSEIHRGCSITRQCFTVALQRSAHFEENSPSHRPGRPSAVRGQAALKRRQLSNSHQFELSLQLLPSKWPSVSSSPSSSLPWPLWRPPSQNPTPTSLQLQPQLRQRQHPTNSTKRGKPNQNPTNTNLQPQQQLHQHPTKSTKRGRLSLSQTPTNLQRQLHQHPTKSTTRGRPSQSQTPTSLQPKLQLHQYPTKRTTRGRPNQNPTTTNLQPQRQLHQRPTKDRRETPPSVRHQSQPVEAPATYQALSSASITICAAVAATIPMTAQPPSLSNVIFLLVPSLVGRYPEWYSVSEDKLAIDIFW